MYNILWFCYTVIRIIFEKTYQLKHFFLLKYESKIDTVELGQMRQVRLAVYCCVRPASPKQVLHFLKSSINSSHDGSSLIFLLI